MYELAWPDRVLAIHFLHLSGHCRPVFEHSFEKDNSFWRQLGVRARRWDERGRNAWTTLGHVGGAVNMFGGKYSLIDEDESG